MAKVSKNTTDPQHVIPLGNGWAVKKESATKFFLITETQREAVTVARQLAQNAHSELIIHGKDGLIRDRFSYAIGGESTARKK